MHVNVRKDICFPLSVRTRAPSAVRASSGASTPIAKKRKEGKKRKPRPLTRREFWRNSDFSSHGPCHGSFRQRQWQKGSASRTRNEISAFLIFSSFRAALFYLSRVFPKHAPLALVTSPRVPPLSNISHFVFHLKSIVSVIESLISREKKEREREKNHTQKRHITRSLIVTNYASRADKKNQNLSRSLSLWRERVQ